jgi:predicted nuclease of predicted toxin-antitoxin system
VPLRILLDENVPLGVITWLCEAHPNVFAEHVIRLFPGASDREVLAYASRNQAVIVTYDEDFGDLRNFPLGTHAGIIRLRVFPTTEDRTILALSRLFESVAVDELEGLLTFTRRFKLAWHPRLLRRSSLRCSTHWSAPPLLASSLLASAAPCQFALDA